MRACLLFLLSLPSASGLTIQVDYRYDTTGFFDNPVARATMEAVAARWGRIINQSLTEVNSVDDEFDRRFALRNPSTGAVIQISSAASAGSDMLASRGAPRADEYWGGIFLPADTIIVFVGARNLPSLGAGGPMSGGFNFDPVFEEENGLLNRGFNSGFGSLTVLGGSISFDSDENWHFDHLVEPEVDKVDFYSIALHEMGHCFGIASTGVEEWSDLVSGWQYHGAKAVAAYQADTGSVLMTLPITGNVGGDVDYHWKDGEVGSKIFPLGFPNYLSTVGVGELQETLMSTTANFTSEVRRKELTNVDVAALEDVGWSVISEDPPPPVPIRLQMSISPTGQFVLVFDSEEETMYRVQTSLDALTWSDVVPAVTGQSGSTTWISGMSEYSDPNNLSISGQAGFFRVVKD